MSDVNQELAKALKLLSEQYEQQFSEVNQQIGELAEQIILLTSSEQSNNDQALSLGGKNARQLSNAIREMNGDSQCVECKHAKYSLQKSNNGQKPNQQFKFTCLLDHDNTESLACFQFDSRF